MKKGILLVVFLTSFFLNTIFLFSSETHNLRFVSLAPSTTEILFALGLDDEIIGVSSFCNYPLKALKKEKVGTFSQPNIEKILSLKPDIIFCTGLEQAPVIEKLKQLNLKVYIGDPKNMEELFNSIGDIGDLVNKEREAYRLIRKMKASIKEIGSKVELIAEKKKPKIFIEIWNDPLMTAGKDSFINELVTLAGGINIAYDTKRPYSYFSPEQVIKRNPDYIILTYMSNKAPVEMVNQRFGWKKIAAVKNNRVYNDIETDLLLRPGPRLVDGLIALHKRLHFK